ncbi:allergen Cr-PI [Anabrus simplex]|uniref:allergen Cr-PI n=1 Tax=Anabrus simplex TaxID=316456 RepID=UPI0034DCC960
MKTITATLVALLATLSAAFVIPQNERRTADKEHLTKQKNIIQLLLHLDQPNFFEDQAALGNNYNLESGKYEQPQIVQQFLKAYNHNLLLARGEVYSILNDNHAEQTKQLYQLLFQASDYDTFYRTACWARDRINEGMFVSALYAAILQRPDTRDILLPPVYEVSPQLFTDSRVIQQAYDARMKHQLGSTVIPYNYSSSLAYFTEDVGLNGYNTLLNYEYPIWLSNISHRGELFLYTRRQLLARYHLERLSLGLPGIDSFHLDFDWPEEIGYIANLRYRNGLEMSSRPDGLFLFKDGKVNIEVLKNIEARLRDAIDSGTFVSNAGDGPSRIFLKDVDAIDVIGNLIHGNADSLNKQYFKSLYMMMLTLFGHPNNLETPGALEHFETSLRDPIYYKIVKRIEDLVQELREQLPSYSRSELIAPGVVIESVETDELVTYQDDFEYSLNNIVDLASKDEISQVDIRVKQQRLNHKFYSIRIALISDKAAKVIVRVFLGPKYDSQGNELSLEAKQPYLVELDRFTYNIPAGKTVIERRSSDSSATVPDQPSTRNLLSQVEDALQGKEPFYIEQGNRQCGLPEHLQLPRGNEAGLPLSMVVVLSPYKEQESKGRKAIVSCGAGIGHQEMDDRHMGFPFDRRIQDPYDFLVPNIYQKDVSVYHKNQKPS